MERKHLSRSAHTRLTGELDTLLTVERPRIARDKEEAQAAAKRDDNTEFMGVLAEEQRIEQRISYIRDVLATAIVEDEGETPTGTIRHGSLVTLQFDGDDDTETFMIGEVVERTDVDVCTPESPMGKALVGAAAGQDITYSTPTGMALTVKVLEVA